MGMKIMMKNLILMAMLVSVSMAGKGSPAVVEATGAEVAVADPNGLVKKGADGLTLMPNVPYRAWNETTRQMEDGVCTNYTIVTEETTTFDDD